MNKKSIAIDYNGQRILLNAVAGYVAIYQNTSNNTRNKHGIRFDLRTGESIERLGDDTVARDNLLEFLDNHFKPVSFAANLCQACINSEDAVTQDCYTKHKCNEFDGYRGFKRKEESAKLSSDVSG